MRTNDEALLKIKYNVLHLSLIHISYGEIQTERPDGEDLKADAEFAKRAAASEAMKSTIPGSRPYEKEAVP